MAKRKVKKVKGKTCAKPKRKAARKPPAVKALRVDVEDLKSKVSTLEEKVKELENKISVTETSPAKEEQEQA